MKISELTIQAIKDSIGITSNDTDALIEIYRPAALAYIAGYTGLTKESIDSHEDLTVAYLCIIGDMYANREVTAPNEKPNPTVEQILSMYSVNYL